MKPAITKQLWIKNWSGRWSACFCSFYGYMYSTGLNERVNKSIAHNLLVYSTETSYNYLPQEELTEFAKYVAQLVEKDNGLPRQWCKETIDNTDELMNLTEKLGKKKKYTKEDFVDLKMMVFKHVVPNFLIKKVADYLSKDLLEKYYKDFSRVRSYTEPAYNSVDGTIKQILDYIARSEKYPKELLYTLTYSEIEKYFDTSVLPDQQELTVRNNGLAIFYLNGKEELIVGKEYAELNDFIIDSFRSKEIKGMPAFKGVAKGKARIIFDPAKAKDFNNGDILVTGMTTPEFLPLMKRAAGFITDAGGILSHAAIISREFKKPCIVGTEVATKTLKDGDLIELDANKGIVRKV